MAVFCLEAQREEKMYMTEYAKGQNIDSGQVLPCKVIRVLLVSLRRPLIRPLDLQVAPQEGVRIRVMSKGLTPATKYTKENTINVKMSI